LEVVNPASIVRGSVVGAAAVFGSMRVVGSEAAAIGAQSGGLTLFHGTDALSAANIVAKGLNVSRAAEVGGGDIFWTTTVLKDAKIFAGVNPAMGVPATVQMQLSAPLVQSLQAKGYLEIQGSVHKFSAEAWKILNKNATFSTVP
jgi:hypothetical protein